MTDKPVYTDGGLEITSIIARRNLPNGEQGPELLNNSSFESIDDWNSWEYNAGCGGSGSAKHFEMPCEQQFKTSGDFYIEGWLPMPNARDKIERAEQKLFAFIVDNSTECNGVKEGGEGCACTGRCLGYWLAQLRVLADAARGFDSSPERWRSDQLHDWLAKRPHDSGQSGDVLNANNYWPKEHN